MSAADDTTGAERDLAVLEQVATLKKKLDAMHVNARSTYVAMRKDIDDLMAERDAAKAREARLRERVSASTRYIEDHHAEEVDDGVQFDDSDAEELVHDNLEALAATDSSAWLEAKIAERTSDAVAKILADINVASGRVVDDGIRDLRAQLAAATAAAARAELRARDAVDRLRITDLWCADNLPAIPLWGMYGDTGKANQALLAAAPDSDARLREVMADAAERVASRERLLPIAQPHRRQAILSIIDEVLGAKP